MIWIFIKNIVTNLFNLMNVSYFSKEYTLFWCKLWPFTTYSDRKSERTHHGKTIYELGVQRQTYFMRLLLHHEDNNNGKSNKSHINELSFCSLFNTFSCNGVALTFYGCCWYFTSTWAYCIHKAVVFRSLFLNINNGRNKLLLAKMRIDDCWTQ